MKNHTVKAINNPTIESSKGEKDGFDCRFRRSLPTICRSAASVSTTKTPVSSTTSIIPTTKHMNTSTNSPVSTENPQLFTKSYEALCRFAENKTRQIGNLNTVNKMRNQKTHKHHTIPAPASTTHLLTVSTFTERLHHA